MNLTRYATLPLLLGTLAACSSEVERQQEATEDQIEMQADASAAAAGSQIVALGLTETQLLDADLVDPSGVDLGDIEQVRRGSTGSVDGLLISIEDTDPDRYVMVPLDGLTTRNEGDDVDVQTSLTAADLSALPDAELQIGASATGTPTRQQ